MQKEIYVSPDKFRLADYERFVIVADIGSNHTYVGIAAIKDKNTFKIIIKYTLLTKEIIKVHEILNKALEEAYREYKIEISRAILAAAGPVSRKRNYIKLTNLDLRVDREEILQHSLLRKVILLNDFEAIGYGLDLLNLNTDTIMLPHVSEDMTTPSLVSNTFSVIGAGNGLGVSIAYYDNIRHMHIPLPSEGGHIEFSAHDEIEIELVNYIKNRVLKKKEAHPEFERFVSGDGIIHIYEFLRNKGIYPYTDLAAKIDSLKGIEKLKAIDANQGNEICKMTMDLFISFYARAARNIALVSECYSGLFITGGIVLHHLNKFQDGSFMKEFEMHDIRSDVLRKTPVYIITNKDIGLLGCCNVAVNFYNLV
jgi:glucokinase